jgi:hypothetical protein
MGAKEKSVESEHCPRCSDLRLCNNWTNYGVCDNCWNDEVRKAQRRLAKKYGKGDDNDDT